LHERFLFFRVSPITRRRLINFRSNRRGFWCFWIFLCLFTFSLFAEFVANDKPLLVRYEKRFYFPVLYQYPETTFGGFLPTEADYRDPEVEKLIRLVEGIEDLAKAEASFFSGMDYTEINLQEFLSNVVNKLTPLSKEKGLEMQLMTNRFLQVITDPGKLESIVQNILTNAIRNTESGGIGINYGISDRMFFVEIADTGPGIPDGETALIFKRFYRGEGSEGKGLGLAIVKELVDMMAGRIELKSKVGEGSVFTVWLPKGS